MLSIITELIVKDIEKNIEFFCDNFGFKVNQKEAIGDKIRFVELINESSILYLQSLQFTKLEFPKIKIKKFPSNLILFQLESEQELLDIYKKIKLSNSKFYSDIKTTDYSTKEFVILSPDKYLIEVWCNL